MSNEKIKDLIGLGLGPFNLSLAALLSPLKDLKLKFLDDKLEFSWHQELMFPDSSMQTSYLKDLVTPVEATNPHSFMNYLVSKKLFYQFLNVERKTITRYEFQDYCRWVSENIAENLSFSQSVKNVDFSKDHFVIETQDQTYYSKNICLGSGPVKNIPECAQSFLGPKVFHAKSKELAKIDLREKKVLIVGGGQTGLEIFRNTLQEKWGRVKSLTLISARPSLQPLDEAPFTNEFFNPSFVHEFYHSTQVEKDHLLETQLLSSDGNTPSYLKMLYEELYLDRFYLKKFPDYVLAPGRTLKKIKELDSSFEVTLHNKLYQSAEVINADIIILATGFRSQLPLYMKTLYKSLEFDQLERPLLEIDYSLKTILPQGNKIFAMNLSRHCHGIADPQTSLMAWRSGMIGNSILGRNHFAVDYLHPNFTKYNSIHLKENL